MPQQDDKQQKKDQIRQLVDRAKSDPSFKQQFSSDPVATLEQAGFSEAAIQEILGDEGLGPDDPRRRGKKGSFDDARAADCWLTDCPCTRCCITSF